MSTKFEQLLDYLVNEDMEKANELFHEIVVEKSRDIYENLIAEEDDEDMEEAAEDEEMDESAEDEEMDESADEEADESVDLEDSYMMDGDDTGDSTDDFGGEISADGDNFDAPEDDAMGHEEQEDSAIMDIKNAIAELEAAFAELEQAQGGEEADMGMDSEFDDEEGEDEMMGMPMENRRVTREYVEKVNHNYSGNTQKQQGQYAGAGTGEKQSAPVEGKSPVSSGKGKPTTGASASNIVGDQSTGEGTNVGTSPAGKAGGLSPEKGEFSGNDWQTNSAPGGKAGVKNLKKVGAGYPGNNKSAGPVGSGTGDKAGQTSVSSDKPFLKKL
jgi:hypothetical protein